MTENTTSSFVSDDLLLDDKPIWYPTSPKIKGPTPPKFPPDKDIELWLEHNSPLTSQQLADIRYSLYHHCSRADFTVAKAIGDDQFELIGRHSKLRVISNRARHYFIVEIATAGTQTKMDQCPSSN